MIPNQDVLALLLRNVHNSLTAGVNIFEPISNRKRNSLQSSCIKFKSKVCYYKLKHYCRREEMHHAFTAHRCRVMDVGAHRTFMVSFGD